MAVICIWDSFDSFKWLLVVSASGLVDNLSGCPPDRVALATGELTTGDYRFFTRGATDSTQTRDRFNADWPIKRDRFNAHNFHNPQLFVDNSKLLARPVPSHGRQSTNVSATCPSQPPTPAHITQSTSSRRSSSACAFLRAHSSLVMGFVSIEGFVMACPLSWECV